VARADAAVTARIAETYHWALVPEQIDPQAPPTITQEKADGANDRLAERVTDRLTRSGLLAGQLAPRTLRLELDQKLDAVWGKGHVSVGDLWGYLCRYPYLPRVRDRQVLDVAVRDVLTDIGWEIDGFVLAGGFDEKTRRYVGLVMPGAGASIGQITDVTLLVHPGVAKAQSEEAIVEPDACPNCGLDIHEGECDASRVCTRCGRLAHEGDCVPGATCADCGAPAHVGQCLPPRPPSPTNTRFYGVYKVDAERYGRDFGRIGQEILAHIAAAEGADLDITIEVHARRTDGFDDDKVRILLENARTLKFQTYGFED
jgi:hypothetical protein